MVSSVLSQEAARLKGSLDTALLHGRLTPDLLPLHALQSVCLLWHWLELYSFGLQVLATAFNGSDRSVAQTPYNLNSLLVYDLAKVVGGYWNDSSLHLAIALPLFDEPWQILSLHSVAHIGELSADTGHYSFSRLPTQLGCSEDDCYAVDVYNDCVEEPLSSLLHCSTDLSAASMVPENILAYDIETVDMSQYRSGDYFRRLDSYIIHVLPLNVIMAAAFLLELASYIRTF